MKQTTVVCDNLDVRETIPFALSLAFRESTGNTLLYIIMYINC